MSNVAFARTQDTIALVDSNPMDHLSKINRFNQPDANAYSGTLRGYVFITRPDMNLFDDKLKLVTGLSSIAGISAMYDPIASEVDKMVIKMLQHNTGFPSAYMPILTNYVKGYTTEDQSMETIEMGESLHGTRIKYGKHSKPTRTSGTVTLTFEDSKYFPVYKLISLWTDYIEMVFLGDIEPKKEYIKKGILDYASALFYLVVKGDGSEIVYWEKLVGVFPRNRPDSTFSTTKGESTYPEYSIQFEYSMKTKGGILDPYVLSEMNRLSRFTHNLEFIEDPIYDRRNNRPGNFYVNAPLIERGKEKHNKGKFLLTWV